MNLLQKICNLFITENKLYTDILAIPLTFVEALITALIFTSILNIKHSKNQILIYVFSFSIIANIACLFIPVPYNSIVNIILSPLLVFIIFKTSFLKSILSEVIPYLLFIIFGSILINIYIFLVHIPSEFVVNIPIYSITYSLILYLIVYIVYKIFAHFNFTINIFPKVKPGITK